MRSKTDRTSTRQRRSTNESLLTTRRYGNNSIQDTIDRLKELRTNVNRCHVCGGSFGIFFRPARTCAKCLRSVCSSCSSTRLSRERIPIKHVLESRDKLNYRVCRPCATHFVETVGLFRESDERIREKRRRANEFRRKVLLQSNKQRVASWEFNPMASSSSTGGASAADVEAPSCTSIVLSPVLTNRKMALRSYYWPSRAPARAPLLLKPPRGRACRTKS